MGRVTVALEHMPKEEILEAMKRTSGFGRFQRWLVIWNALVDPRPAGEIALHTGMAVQTVHNLVSRYNRFGPQAVDGPGKGGRRRYYLSWEQEEAFLRTFVLRARNGAPPTAAEIKEALEHELGHPIHKSTVYRMLGRHGCRDLVLRKTLVRDARPVSIPREQPRESKRAMPPDNGVSLA